MMLYVTDCCPPFPPLQGWLIDVFFLKIRAAWDPSLSLILIILVYQFCLTKNSSIFTFFMLFLLCLQVNQNSPTQAMFHLFIASLNKHKMCISGCCILWKCCYYYIFISKTNSILNIYLHTTRHQLPPSLIMLVVICFCLCNIVVGMIIIIIITERIVAVSM